MLAITKAMPIEIMLLGMSLVFLAKVAIYTGAACIVVRYAGKQLDQ